VRARADYPLLFGVIGTTYNTGGETGAQFRLPDLRGEFIRGLDAGRGVDTGRTLGSGQGDAIQRHNHYLPTSTDGTGANVGAAILDSSFDLAHSINVAPNPGYNAVTVGHDGSQYGDGDQGIAGDWAAETRPRNVAMNYIIKT